MKIIEPVKYSRLIASVTKIFIVRLKIPISINVRFFFSSPFLNLGLAIFGPRKKYGYKLLADRFSKNKEQLATSSPYVVAVLETEKEKHEGGERKKRVWSIEMEPGRGKKEKQNKIRMVSYAPACMINVAI